MEKERQVALFQTQQSSTQIVDVQSSESKSKPLQDDGKVTYYYASALPPDRFQLQWKVFENACSMSENDLALTASGRGGKPISPNA